jgi:hypothetical protein
VKAIIKGMAFFNGGVGDDDREVPIQVLGAPDEDMDDGQILIVHPKCSIELNLRELQAALRMFEK